MSERDGAEPREVRAWERWHPLCCEGFTLSANQMVAAKLLAFYWLPRRVTDGFGAPFVPFIETLDRPALALVWPGALTVAYVTAAVALLLNRAPRTCAAVCAMVIFADVLAAQGRYANSTLIFGFLLVLLALQTRESGLWMLRVQMTLMYAGAALNKLLHPDWPSGRYMEFWTQDVMGLEWLGALASRLHGETFFVALSWLVIASEASMAVTMAVPRLLPVAAALAVVFHVGMLLFTEGRISWIFAYAVGCAVLALWRWRAPLRYPSWPWLEGGAARALVRCLLPGASRADGPGAPASAPWRWPVSYLAVMLLFFAARRLWKLAA